MRTPQLPPERDVLRSKAEHIAAQKGTKSMSRYGEEYIVTCTCGAMRITSNMTSALRFENDHEPC
jgi:hypothetical protein